jgi:hypothetical protein
MLQRSFKPAERFRRAGIAHHRDALLVGGAHPTVVAMLIMASVAAFATAARGQFAPPPIPTAPLVRSQPAATLPEPIYWKQHLFLIPYQWGSAAEPGAARAVWLFVSKDRGASWQKISEAKPDVKAFNYRAEGDGEYWFAVRTFDKLGRAWPQGPYQPELRVIVDTTQPRIEELRAMPAANGMLEIAARVGDSNLDPNSWRFEWQADAAGPWQPAQLQNASVQAIGNTGLPLGGTTLHAFWQTAGTMKPVALRGTVADRAGNTATYQLRLNGAATVSGPLLTAPVVNTAPASPTAGPGIPAQPASRPSANPLQASDAAQGWESAGSHGATTTTPTQPAQPAAPPATQPWPAANTERAPFQLWTNTTGSAAPKDDGVTAYGNPKLFDAPQTQAKQAAPRQPPQLPPRVEAKYAGISVPSTAAASSPPPADASHPPFAALEPYREPAASAVPLVTAPPISQAPNPQTSSFPPTIPSAPLAVAALPAAADRAVPTDVTPVDSPQLPHAPPSPPKLVGSRTFALEYDLDDAGRNGITRVELWGSRDGGKTWNRYAQDNDNRSPLTVTVDEEGLYGFRIVVQTAGSLVADTPRPGDAPELWVQVDLRRPTVELTAIERGQGNLSDHLILHWRAIDNNLENRPIGLFYSSRPTGPWSAIATNLENTGQYAWRVERYVPARFFLRVEARDTAGNMAAFQTREPIEFSPSSVAGRLRSSDR